MKKRHTKKEAPPRGQLTMEQYNLARKLQKATRERIVASGGEIGSMEIYATLLIESLLGGK